MKKNYFKKILVLVGLLCINSFFAQNLDKKEATTIPITINSQIKSQLLSSNISIIERNANQILASTISPLNQTICSGSPITNITTTSPSINAVSKLDCITGGTGTYITAANNGIYFDISNSGTVPVRIAGFDFIAYASTATTATINQTFTIYKTTSTTTAAGNYNTAANWTNLGAVSFALPATAQNSGYILTSYIDDNGFTLSAGASVGIYIVCNNATTTDWKLGYRNTASTGSPITDTNVTVTHKSRGDGFFSGGTTLRGFIGNVYYHSGTYGYWTRNNTTNITGTTTAGNAGSGATPFPISGTLTNGASTPQTTIYTITSYDVNGVKNIQTASILVNPTPINTVTLSGDTLTADQIGATYQWFDCNNGNAIITGETSQSFTPSIDGNYGVTVTLNNSCSVNSTCTSVLSSNLFESNNNFIMYPNPNNGFFTIKSNFDGEIKIFNQLGQVIKVIEISQEEKNMDMSNFATGIYYVNAITKEGKNTTQRLAIK